MPRNLAELYEERRKLQRDLEVRVGCGCGSAVIDWMEKQIKEVEQHILQAHQFVCPHCNKSLEHLADPPVKATAPKTVYVWQQASYLCPHCRSKQHFVRSIGNDHDDEEHECRECGKHWRVDGPDA